MSQVQIYNFLKQNEGKSFNGIQLAKKLNINPSTINGNLRRIVILDDIEWEIKKVKIGTATKELKHYYWRNKNETKF